MFNELAGLTTGHPPLVKENVFQSMLSCSGVVDRVAVAVTEGSSTADVPRMIKSQAVMVPIDPPIHTLPVELVVQVFAEYSDTSDDDDDDEWWTTHLTFGIPLTRMGWTKHMLVCRRWREIGLATPQLWRRISVTTNLESLQYRLSRSAGCTIDLFFKPSFEAITAAMPTLLQHAGRIRSIATTTTFTVEDMPSLQPLFAVDMPELTSLEMMPTNMINPAPASVHPHATESSNLELSGVLYPQIQKLMGIQLRFSTESPSWPKLRVLELDLHEDQVPTTMPADMLRMLASAPYLESLELSYECPAEIVTMNAPLPLTYADLPHLSSIYLCGPGTFVASLLHGINAPNLEELRIHVVVPTTGDAEQLCTYLLPPMLNYHLAQLNQIYLRAGHAGFCICDSEYPASSRFSMKVTVERPTTIILLALQVLASVLPTASTSVQHLSVEDLPGSPPTDVWAIVFMAFSTLQSLKFTDCSRNVICAALDALLKLSLEHRNESLKGIALKGCLATSLDSHDVLSRLLDFACVRAARSGCASALKEVTLRLDHYNAMSFSVHRDILLALASQCRGRLDFVDRHGNSWLSWLCR